MKKNEIFEGGCICGEVKYKITEKPLFTQACHCKDCKILTGSSFIVNTSILDNSLHVEGVLTQSIKLEAGSGASYRIYFCNKCATDVYADYESVIGRLTVRTKTLNKSKDFPPQAHIFVKDKDPWLNLPNDDICFKEMYDPKKVWPEESLSRYKEYLKNNLKN